VREGHRTRRPRPPPRSEADRTGQSAPVRRAEPARPLRVPGRGKHDAVGLRATTGCGCGEVELALPDRMSTLRIFCFGVQLPPVDGLEHLALSSKQSLLDADIVVMRPSLREFRSEEYFQGLRSLDDNASFQAQNALSSWSTKLKAARDAKKTVIFLMPEREGVFVDTGTRTYSGTGRNRQTTRLVDSFDNYKFIPANNYNPVFESGTAIVPARQIGAFSTLFNHYKDHWRYNCYISSDKLRALMVTKSGQHIVGAVSPSGFILLPDIDFGLHDIWQYANSGNPKFKDGERLPTAAAAKAAFAFRDQLVALRNTLVSEVESTPPPDWAADGAYRLPQEYSLESEINELNKQLEEVSSKQEQVRDQLADAGELRALLYGTGKQLERAVQRALTILGFSAVPFVSDTSEFDVVFESDEGRFIGEVEGKDTSAINVLKISQLRRNVDEDFQRDEVDRPAIGVLFGNGFRHEEPALRDACFTEKVTTSAPTLGIVLVRTFDLFLAAKAALETPDPDFSLQCRRAIADSVGEIVQFPRIEPSEVREELAEQG
jgi:hypothetical protein